MAETNNLILELLRGLRNQIEGFQTETRSEFRDVKQRLNSLENAVLGVKRDEISTASDIARQQASLDQIIERIQRIEKRLQLTEG